MENRSSKTKAALWDCGSTLYDSFELNSFKCQLDSAIANSARSLSMPHLSDRGLPAPPPPPPTMSKKPFKISRSLQKLLRSVFKLNNNNHNHHSLKKASSVKSSRSSFQVPQKSGERYLVVYDKQSGPVLSSIPELPEFEMAKVSPDITSLVKRSASERFTPTTMGISCA
ncbi:probable serine/threonine-protein kinase pats1 [Neltuma alba]|uniref:probable serine/threonine-protein kinase pats1 n=1 Tax=Neltuma alba TaxID=207710 RepID=UPI0010A2EE25|nr:probable serine/threonine-protein kinase pats1 [Prosopis alba]